MRLALTRFARARGGDPLASPQWLSPAQRRRIDPLTRLACGPVDELLRQGAALSPDTALIASTSYGAVESTLRFIGSMAEFSDRGASPTPPGTWSYRKIVGSKPGASAASFPGGPSGS